MGQGAQGIGIRGLVSILSPALTTHVNQSQLPRSANSKFLIGKVGEWVQ